MWVHVAQELLSSVGVKAFSHRPSTLYTFNMRLFLARYLRQNFFNVIVSQMIHCRFDAMTLSLSAHLSHDRQSHWLWIQFFVRLNPRIVPTFFDLVHMQFFLCTRPLWTCVFNSKKKYPIPQTRVWVQVLPRSTQEPVSHSRPHLKVQSSFATTCTALHVKQVYNDGMFIGIMCVCLCAWNIVDSNQTQPQTHIIKMRQFR
jgi:hypothetical protein